MIICTHTQTFFYRCLFIIILFHFIHRYEILNTVPCVYIAGRVLLCFDFWIKASPPGFEHPALPPHSCATLGKSVVSESQFPPLSSRNFVRVRWFTTSETLKIVHGTWGALTKQLWLGFTPAYFCLSTSLCNVYIHEGKCFVSLFLLLHWAPGT